jgi:hypothetical protein
MSRLGSRTSTSSIAARVAAVLSIVVTFVAILLLVLAHLRRRFRTGRVPAN